MHCHAVRFSKWSGEWHTWQAKPIQKLTNQKHSPHWSSSFSNWSFNGLLVTARKQHWGTWRQDIQVPAFFPVSTTVVLLSKHQYSKSASTQLLHCINFTEKTSLFKLRATHSLQPHAVQWPYLLQSISESVSPTLSLYHIPRAKALWPRQQLQ